nr:MAG TPA: hypothetical protein [Caudoviricetes sp.]
MQWTSRRDDGCTTDDEPYNPFAFPAFMRTFISLSVWE